MRNKCKFFKRGRKQEGITLVALVVTIVVLLILAGVSLSLVLNNNGIITRAGDAKEEYGKAKENEQKDLDSAEDYINQMTGGGSGTGSLPTKEGSTPYLPSSEFSQVSGTNLENGLVIEDGCGNQYVWIEVPKTADVYGADNLNITNFTEEELNTIKIKLMKYVEDYGNSDYSDTWYDGCGVSQENYPIMYNKMLKSVYQNGGFWIGRYEIGIDENTVRSYGSEASTLHPTTGQTPVIKANKVPYNWIRCSQAEGLAETFAPSGYTSSLMFGLQWDLVLKYLETKGVTQEELKGTTTGSTSWGNYSDANLTVTNTSAKYSEDEGASWKSITAAGYTKASSSPKLLTTGANETRNSKQNICDLAGNLWEWTLEQYTPNSSSGTPLAERGGGYNYVGSGRPASSRTGAGESISHYDSGARVTLY